jgi:16S rRNA C967 or C1407 C5-methylase (RsmB/RsmF family)/NOL1/NOP2/fmu family ribosome biogenesis protein
MPSLPQEFLNSLLQLPYFDEQAFVEAHQEENKITSIRLNPFKKAKLDFDLNDPVLWSGDGFYLHKRPSFTLDPLFHTGCYYVQEAGSMFLEFALKQTVNLFENIHVLDLCASPGGKSTLINSLLNENSLLVANELIKSRADVLVQNLSKWGTSNTVVTNNDSEKFTELNGFFDVVVVDAPCSGSGLFRKQPDAIAEWSKESVISCSLRQQNILQNVLPSLRTGGILVYSTCSYSLQENEDVVKWLCRDFEMETIRLSVPKEWGIVESDYGYRFYPHLSASEGFFCSVLRKTQNNSSAFFTKKKNNIEVTKADASTLRAFVNPSANVIIKKNNQFHLLNSLALNFLNTFEKQFYFKKAGVVIGEIKGHDVVPNQELAWALNISDNVQRIELDKENAVLYLKKENFQVPQSANGLSLITYKNYGLGWAKILPNRNNNYLPNELKIRLKH